MSASANPRAQSFPLEVTTFLTFSGAQYGKAEEAIRFYVSQFPHSEVEYLTRHGPGDRVPAGELQRAAFTLAGRRFMATESLEDLRFNSSFSLYVRCRTPEELTGLFKGLSEGGTIHMPLGPYPSSELFVWFDDKYGVSWQLEIPASVRH